ncbi:hypothetical protein BaRGS_00025459, partial [Batillaria attramentaria]
SQNITIDEVFPECNATLPRQTAYFLPETTVITCTQKRSGHRPVPPIAEQEFVNPLHRPSGNTDPCLMGRGTVPTTADFHTTATTSIHSAIAPGRSSQHSARSVLSRTYAGWYMIVYAGLGMRAKFVDAGEAQVIQL